MCANEVLMSEAVQDIDIVTMSSGATEIAGWTQDDDGTV